MRLKEHRITITILEGSLTLLYSVLHIMYLPTLVYNLHHCTY